jgi:hypothetical protein
MDKRPAAEITEIKEIDVRRGNLPRICYAMVLAVGLATGVERRRGRTWIS